MGSFHDFYDYLYANLFTYDALIQLTGFRATAMLRRRWRSWAVNWNSDHGVHEHRPGEVVRTYGVIGVVFLVCSLPPLPRNTPLGYIQWFHIERLRSATPEQEAAYFVAVEALMLCVFGIKQHV